MKIAKSKVHFIGIGGIGMCGLAELLANMGAQVTGSDLVLNKNSQHLIDMGVTVYQGHRAENLGDADVVVYSSAVKSHNVEFREAKRKKIPLIPRAEALAEMMRMKRGVAIAGTHGKTTTTSLTSTLFLEGNLNPTLVVGGRVALLNSTAHLGEGEWLIAEADESDGSFNRLSPEIVVITNIDDDHLDHYGSFKNLQSAFYDFALRIPFYGALIYCGDDIKTRQLFEDFPKKKISYGFDSRNDYSLIPNEEGGYSFFYLGKKKGSFKLPLAGDHNALNGLASLLVGSLANLSFDDGIQAIKTFKGVERRFQWKGTVRGIDIYDDYGHHPTEVKSVLDAFSKLYPNRRKVVLFQPHRYSRTQLCWEGFLQCFGQCDQLFLTDIYPAGEAPLQGVDSQVLSDQILHSSCHYVAFENLKKTVKEHLKEGDVCITLGAGPIWKTGEELIQELQQIEG